MGVELTRLSACEARDKIARGELRSEELIRACLKQIQQQEEKIQAWTYLDPEYALKQAQRADQQRQSGRPIGPLHGVPVGIKDIIDTADMPTENGNLIDAGRRPDQDAAVVSRLRAAGAVILGKTVTTECAHLAPSKTRNPHNPEHTPGGSSAGSAAAVAAHMVPFALGTQTGGSVTRPAAYCGIVGFKPSFGLIARTGILRQSPWLDTVGTMAHTLEDAALLADAIAGFDVADSESCLQAAPRLYPSTCSEPPVRPVLGFIQTPPWAELDQDCIQGLAELRAILDEYCENVTLPEVFQHAPAMQQRLALVGIAHHLSHYQAKGQLADETLAAIDAGGRITALHYLQALDFRQLVQTELEQLFYRYDALIAPATTGAAPKDLSTTGNPAFCVAWTLAGVPSLSLPLLESADGMPIGVQLIGRKGYDGRLLRTARWLLQQLE